MLMIEILKLVQVQFIMDYYMITLLTNQLM